MAGAAQEAAAQERRRKSGGASAAEKMSPCEPHQQNRSQPLASTNASHFYRPK